MRSWRDRVRTALSRRLGFDPDVEWGYWPLEKSEELWSDEPDESEDRKLTDLAAAASRTGARGPRAGGAAAALLLLLTAAWCRASAQCDPANAPRRLNIWLTGYP
jgi:hypothetical protein